MADYLLCSSVLENMQVLFHTQITYNTEEHLNYIIAEDIIHFCLSLTYIKSSKALGHMSPLQNTRCCRVVREKVHPVNIRTLSQLSEHINAKMELEPMTAYVILAAHYTTMLSNIYPYIIFK